MPKRKGWSWWCIMKHLPPCVTTNAIWIRPTNLWLTTDIMPWKVVMLAISFLGANITMDNGWTTIIYMPWRKPPIIKSVWMRTKLYVLLDYAVLIPTWSAMNRHGGRNMKLLPVINLFILLCFHSLGRSAARWIIHRVSSTREFLFWMGSIALYVLLWRNNWLFT